MINIKFKLKDPNGLKPTSIQCFFYYQSKRFTFSLGNDKKILPALWDNKTQRPSILKSLERKDVKFSDKYDLNNLKHELENINFRIKNVINEISRFINIKELNNQKLILDELKKHLNCHFRDCHQNSIDKVNLNNYIKTFIDDLESGVRTYTTSNGERKIYTKSTILTYKDFQTQFETYQKSKNRKLNFKDVNLEFYNQYVDHFTKRGFKNNSIGKQIKILKTLLSAALEDGHHSNNDFKKKQFKTLNSDVFNIFLSSDELNILNNLDLTAQPQLELIRDVFLCGCFTALRFSDYKRITKDNFITFDDRKYVQIITLKTNQKVIIPVSPDLDNILRKYDYNIPYIYEQKINRTIKQIGRMAGINSIIEIKSIKGAKIQIDRLPKYKLITTHTGRRTGATLLYLTGAGILDIMKITGHKSEKSFLKYIKMSEEEAAIRLLNNPFFTRSNPKKI